MSDFLNVVPEVKLLFEDAGISVVGRNLEDVYSDLHQMKHRDLVVEVEEGIRRYFESLCLPARPTIYDYLLLSLREKDVVATFNWDPFLIQAARRSPWPDRLPKLNFLHGNVLSGSCFEHDVPVQALSYEPCPQCGRSLEKSRLLFPVREKNYDSDRMISASWKQIRSDLEASFMVTVFGYGAPKSDAVAIALLKDALRQWHINQFEIVDVRSEEELRDLWEPFVEQHKYHYKTHDNFLASWLALHPRRTGEALKLQYWDGEFIENRRLPIFETFEDLWQWFEPLLTEE
jgi:hypothetical protein